MYRVAICDDEPLFTRNLKKMTQEVLTDIGIDFDIAEFTSANHFLKCVQKNPLEYNLILLDILLGEQNGVEIAKTLREAGTTSSILFVTCTKDFALESYSVYPIHYLVKPVQKEQLFQIINREYREKFLVKHIIIPVKGGARAVELGSILYIEVLNRSIIVHTTGAALECSGTLKEFLQIIPDGLFVQCHKSFVVNMAKLRKVSKTIFYLKNNEEIPVGRVYCKTAIDKFVEYINHI